MPWVPVERPARKGEAQREEARPPSIWTDRREELTGEPQSRGDQPAESLWTDRHSGRPGQETQPRPDSLWIDHHTKHADEQPSDSTRSEGIGQRQDSVPAGSRPDGLGSQRPAGQYPEGQRSAGQRPDDQRPDSQRPGSQRPEGQWSDDQRSGGQGPGSQRPEGQWSDDQRSGSQRFDNQRPEGQRPDDSRRDGPREDQRWNSFRSEAPDQFRDDGQPGQRPGDWSQQIELREGHGDEPGDRRGLPPEPPRGMVPSASSSVNQARPMRIEPSGEQFPAEATVGIERPSEGFPLLSGQPGQQNQPGQQGQYVPHGQDHDPADDRGYGDGPPQEPPYEPYSPAEPPRKRKRGKKLVVIGAVVVLLLAAAGVAAAMPKVSTKLGLPWAPANAPKSDIPDPASVSLALHGPDTTGQGPSAGGVGSALSGPAANKALAQLTGSVIDPATGDVLWDHGSTTALTPASTTKILTVSAALLSMEPTKRLTTKIVQGAQPGTVILVGGGDPSLTTLPIGTDSPLYPGDAHVDDLVAQVKKATGGDVSKVQLDLSAYTGPQTAPGWEPGDAPSTYGAPIVPAMTDGGRINPKVDETPRSGTPATALAQLIAGKLGAQAGGTAKAPDGAKVLGQVQSAPLPDLAYALLQISDNVLADALGRQVAITAGADPSFTGAGESVKKVLQDHGFDVSNLQLFDTSGLSNQNRVPARLLAQILAAAAAPDGKSADTAKLRPLLAGLPVAGSPAGTLGPRYQSGDSAAGKGWVRAKTGTLTSVNTLAGYVLDKDNRVLVFAFMSNGSDKNPGQAALDVLATTLRNCGCH
ncbi:D-alanyl-D-alanine carboxypeptidase/D-alanyl-D-alanine endopeptidase [Amycolatopsis saalfeldensis]|uniref:D-alanyl-D-alanine carboxypeptidase / D-alanyl-D-alanine-endopeptidase (Penicillin-binding protein 4) n=1 Tax=Amycolatopsis saalfeldensis TaxID=394193 RepID=A0A1H8WAR1_9PSEU|nr:D-alanyl-D-alanine carboxypeptidase/D-alanyl-D-alanine-endopeptidase [Amycolatopsis saalfeldensis]SEP24517.1 D-alanyl-D-alanine carboxypeptidase / D-alanyl-D-alanine-endopeptidase (penicillin-binding protein 4) [Amycolatopsis saalfeldensis]